jgi:hypothetical protein
MNNFNVVLMRYGEYVGEGNGPVAAGALLNHLVITMS